MIKLILNIEIKNNVGGVLLEKKFESATAAEVQIARFFQPIIMEAIQFFGEQQKSAQIASGKHITHEHYEAARKEWEKRINKQ